MLLARFINFTTVKMLFYYYLILDTAICNAIYIVRINFTKFIGEFNVNVKKCKSYSKQNIGHFHLIKVIL